MDRGWIGGVCARVRAGRAAGPAWHVLKQVRSGSYGGFTALVTTGQNSGWAFDGFSAPTAWQRSGSAWTRVPFPGLSGEEVIAAGAAGPRDVWAVTAGGSQSRALRWDGRAWTVQKTFPGQTAAAIVISPADVWVFGQLYQPGGGIGTWHYNRSTWSRVRSAQGLAGGSAVSASDIWALGGTSVAHWNGRTWTWTSVARLLPPRQPLNFPTVKGIIALSDRNVYAIGSGNAQDEGGPTVVLHYDGHAWAKVADGYYGAGAQPDQQVISDGHGGLWIPMPASTSGLRTCSTSLPATSPPSRCRARPSRSASNASRCSPAPAPC